MTEMRKNRAWKAPSGVFLPHKQNHTVSERISFVNFSRDTFQASRCTQNGARNSVAHQSRYGSSDCGESARCPVAHYIVGYSRRPCVTTGAFHMPRIAGPTKWLI